MTSKETKLQNKPWISQEILKSINNKLNLRKIWNGIKEIINLKKSNKSQPRCIKINEIYITNQNEITKIFNEYFTTIAEKRDSKIKTKSN